MSKENGAILRDPRVDRLITWVLAVACMTTLSVGAWFFKGLQDEMANLSSAIRELSVGVAIVRTEQRSMIRRLDRLEEATR